MKLHLGCGSNLLDGWQNLDALPQGPGVVVWNAPDRLPFQDHSVDLVYAEHFVEHLTLVELTALLGELSRVMDANAVLRFSTPDLKTLVADYAADKLDRWHGLGWRPAGAAALLNEGMREWGHRFVHDLDSLTVALNGAGFEKVKRMKWRASRVADLKGLESRPDCGDLIVEATRVVSIS